MSTQRKKYELFLDKGMRSKELGEKVVLDIAQYVF